MPAFRFAGALVALAWAFCILLTPASAASGPFANFNGSWSGTGTLRPSDGAAERIRCDAQYRTIGKSEVDLQLRCASDSYKFDLSGKFSADERDHISGFWTERSRSVSGSIAGDARGNRLQVRAESPGFSATLLMVTSNRQQSVTIDSKGGDRIVKASITLSRH